MLSSRFTRFLLRRPAIRWLRVALLLLVWSLCLGWGLAHTKPMFAAQEPIGTVDAVPQQFQLGQELYLQNCATCHLGLPPAVLPTQTWTVLIQDPQHYGVQLQPLRSPDLELVSRYLTVFSRSINRSEPVPFRVQQSRYFRALHPQVEFPQPVSVRTCGSCHPAAAQFNYRTLSAEWEGR